MLSTGVSVPWVKDSMHGGGKTDEVRSGGFSGVESECRWQVTVERIG